MAVTGQPAPDFARLLQQLRAEAGLTQEQLGQAAGVSPRTVSDLERGIHRSAHQDTARLLADALGLTGAVRGLFAAAARGRVSAAEVLAARSELPGEVGPSADGPARVERLLGAIESPYRGLKAFEKQDAALFFGREAATTAVLERMSRLTGDTGLLVVSGVSGAGKSSLLQAGVLPHVQRAGLAGVAGAASWPCLVLTPTRAPLDELALRVAVLAGADAAEVRRELEADPGGFALTTRQAALAPRRGPGETPEGPAGQDQSPPPERRLLLVVDQFEQLFTLCADEGQRRAFITALHAAATPRPGTDQAPAGLVVLGVRADFEARCADYPQLADAVQDRYLVTAMTERQLRMAIAEPARKAGSGVDDNLVEVLLSEARTGQPGALGAGALPLLSHALDQSWRSRSGNAVTLADYERTGGIEGAVASSAQRAYEGLTPAQQAVARQVFTRLTATSDDGVDTANPVTRTELTDGRSAAEIGDVEHVLEAFAAQRLLTLAAGTVEISHEILLTAWPLLRDTWLAETHTDRIIRTRLHNTAAEWAHHDRDPSYLYRGSLLQAAADTAGRITAEPSRHLPLSQAERDFLRASDHVQRRRVRGRQAVLVFLVVLVIGLASAALLAVRASRQAAHQRDIALSGQLIGRSSFLADTNPVLSKLLSIAAWRLNPSNNTRYAMLAAATGPGIAALNSQAGAVHSVAFSPDGTTLAATASGTVQLWNAHTHQPVRSPFPPLASPLSSVAFSPDSKTLAIGDDEGIIRLWNRTGHQPVTSLQVPRGRGLRLAGVKPFSGVSSVAFSPRGNTLATGSDDGKVKLWNTVTSRHTHTLNGHDGQIFSVAFSQHGTTLAAGAGNGIIELWRPVTHKQLSPLNGNAGTIYSVAFRPHGNTLAAGTAAGTVQLWNAARHLQIATLKGNGGPVYSVAFSPDGKTLASASADGTIRLWNVASPQHPQQITALPSQAGTVYSVAFSPDGNTLATGNSNDTVQLWDVHTSRSVGRPLISPNGGVAAAALSLQGNTLAIGNARTVQLWDVHTDHAAGPSFTSPNGDITAVALSTDGNTLAIGYSNDTVQLWDMRPWHQVRAPLRTGEVISLAFSRDGTTLATGNADGTVHLWDVRTGHSTGRLLPTSEVFSLAFSPDGTTLATGNADGTVQLWDIAKRRSIGGPLAAMTVRAVAFSRNGKTLATGSSDGVVRLWDVANHQPIITLTSRASTVYSVAFSADGKTLAVESAGRAVQLWNVAYLVNAMRYLCESARRSLTHAEWARYVPQGPAYEKLCAGYPRLPASAPFRAATAGDRRSMSR
jgi:WD40 repeat protein/transcriptional regulator with XRE-family HTH domain